MKLQKLLAALALLLLATQAHAASLLPNGKQQFFAADGTLCVGCKVYFYIPNTTVPKDTYIDAAATTLNTNPVVADSIGSAIIYGIGTYRQILKDASGNTIWDTVTADQVSLTAAWSGISAGSQNAQTVTNANFSLTDGAQVTFLAGLTNTGPTTLNVSGTGAISVVVDTSTGPQALGGSEITTGNVISVVYDQTGGVFHIVTPTPIQSFNGAVFFNGTITPTILAADQNDWTPTGGFPGANTVRVQASTPIKITGLTGGAAGRTVILHNIGSNSITFAQNSASSLAANRFLFSGPINLRPNDDMTLQYDGLSSGWRLISMRYASPPAALFKKLHVTNGGTPNNQIIGTADAFTLSDTNGAIVTRTALSCTADVTVSGAGGLDTGAVTTSTWYSYWFIYNAQTNTDSCLFSTSQTSPTLPSGYTFAARASWARTDGSSHFYQYNQYARHARWLVGSNPATPVSIGPAASSSLSAVSVLAFVPPTASEIDILLTATAAQSWTSAAPNNSGYNSTSATNPSPCTVLGSAAGFAGIGTGACTIMLESTNIYTAAGGAGVSTANAVWALGWVDNL